MGVYQATLLIMMVEMIIMTVMIIILMIMMTKMTKKSKLKLCEKGQLPVRKYFFVLMSFLTWLDNLNPLSDKVITLQRLGCCQHI